MKKIVDIKAIKILKNEINLNKQINYKKMKTKNKNLDKKKEIYSCASILSQNTKFNTINIYLIQVIITLKNI